MLASLRFSGMNKKQNDMQTASSDSTVESSIAADSTLIINSLAVLLMPFKHYNNTSKYVSKEEK